MLAEKEKKLKGKKTVLKLNSVLNKLNPIMTFEISFNNRVFCDRLYRVMTAFDL